MRKIQIYATFWTIVLAVPFTVIGLVGAATMTQLLTALLFEIKPTDGITYATVVALLGVMSTLAIYLPARRSSKINPAIALRAN